MRINLRVVAFHGIRVLILVVAVIVTAQHLSTCVDVFATGR